MQDHSTLEDRTKHRDSLFKLIPKAKLKEFAEYLDKEKRDNPLPLVQLICEAVLNPEAIEENPFAFALRFIGADRLPPSYKRFAAVLHASVTGRVRSPIEGYVSFLDVMVEWFETERLAYQLEKAVLIDGNDPRLNARNIEAIPFSLTRAYADIAGWALDSVAVYVHEGLPLYRRNQHGGFQMLCDIDALYHYIAKRGEFVECGERHSIPDWTEEVFFRESDFEVHKLYFWGSEDLSPEALAARRAALRSALGISSHQVELSDVASERDRLREQVSALEAKVCNLSSFPDTATMKAAELSDDQAQGKSKTTMLQVIGGLVMANTDMDIHATRLDGLAKLRNDLQTVGVTIGEDALRSYLKEAANLITKSASR